MEKNEIFKHQIKEDIRFIQERHVKNDMKLNKDYYAFKRGARGQVSIVKIVICFQLLYSLKMARPLRIEYEGAFYHVLARGERRDDIFTQDGDK